jgi:predicted ATPase
MIESIEFTNFKALRKTTLPLSPFTLLLGPNGSGKTTVLQALDLVATYTAQQVGISRSSQVWMNRKSLLSVTAEDAAAQVEVKLRLRLNGQLTIATFRWSTNENQPSKQLNRENGYLLQGEEERCALEWIGRVQTYALHSASIASAVPVSSRPLDSNGGGLAAVLDDLKDNHRERWRSLLDEMRHWLPEYDDIQFDRPQDGQKRISLRTKKGAHRIPASELSQGTLIALALLTLAYSPNPPSVVALEEIDRGLHPRLLRHLQDALYRLSYPESCGETRPPIQVIATTHSPYLLDLYRDHPEEVVLARKEGLEVEMKRLADIEHYEEILGDSPLSEVWYSGVLGGVSVKP